MVGAGCGAAPATYDAVGQVDPGASTGSRLNVIA
jgi:hypothetical protein